MLEKNLPTYEKRNNSKNGCENSFEIVNNSKQHYMSVKREEINYDITEYY